MPTTLGIALGACVVVGTFAALLALAGRRDTATFDEDAVIVLGASVHGTTVSGALAGRLDRAIEYRDRNPGALLVVSGGMNPQGEVTEAVAMRNYLVARGVPASGTVLEDRSTSTRENFAFTRELLDGRLASGYQVCFVTDGFHIYRSARMANAAGLDATHLSSAQARYSRPSHYVREMAAVVLMWAGRI